MDEKLFGETKFYVDFEMTTEAKPGDRVAVVVSANGSRMLSSQRPEERPILATPRS